MAYVDGGDPMFAVEGAGGIPGAIEGAMKDLPANFTDPREILTVHTNGQWKVPGTGTPGEDNMGDGQMILDRTVVPHLLRHAYRSGGTQNGCVYTDKPYGDIYSGWSVPGADPEPENPTKAFPSGLNQTNTGNVDTAVIVVNPETLVKTCFFGVKPGSIVDPDTGLISAVQRRTSIAGQELTVAAGWADYGGAFEAEVQAGLAPWTLQREEPPLGAPFEWSGGIGESAIVNDPGAPGEEYVLFYVSKSSGPSQWGTSHKNRIGRRVARKQNFDTAPAWVDSPALGPRSWVFDPQELPGYSSTGSPPWGTMPGHPLQQNVTINPYDRSYHLVLLGHKPFPGQGDINRSLGIGHWWSHDRGVTWTGDSRNPIIDLQWLVDNLGWTLDVGFANRLNSPFLMWDTMTAKVYLMFWGNPTGEQNQPGTRFWGAAFDLGQLLSDLGPRALA